MTAQPLRLGALAMGYAVATATLVLVTVLASNLVLSVVAGLGPAQPAATPTKQEAVLVSGSDRCGDEPRRAKGSDGRDGRGERPARCDGRRATEEPGRP